MQKVLTQFFSDDFKNSRAYKHILPFLKERISLDMIPDMKDDFTLSSKKIEIYHRYIQNEHRKSHCYELLFLNELVTYEVVLEDNSNQESFLFQAKNAVNSATYQMMAYYNKLPNADECLVTHNESCVEYLENMEDNSINRLVLIYDQEGNLKREIHQSPVQTLFSSLENAQGQNKQKMKIIPIKSSIPKF